MYRLRICTKYGVVNLFKPSIEGGSCGVGTANVSLRAAEWFVGRTMGFLGHV